MWPIGHAAIAYICYTGSTRLRFDGGPGTFATVLVGFGSLFPDLVDKPLAWYLRVLPTGRSLAHTLVVLVPLAVLVYLVARRRGIGDLGIAFGLGVISHALVDAAPVLWNPDSSWEFLLWPILPLPGVEEGAPSILALFRSSLADPYFLSEFVFLGIALLLWRADGYPGLELFSGGER